VNQIVPTTKQYLFVYIGINVCQIVLISKYNCKWGILSKATFRKM